VPHLAGITNTIGTAETFNFTYAGAALGPPFGTDASWAGQTTSHLATMNVPSTGNYQFTYDSAGAGELDQVTFPYGGHLRWVYQNFHYAGGRTLREVNARYLAADAAGAVEWGPYTMTHPDAANSVAVHSSTTLTDASGNGAKTWNFLGGSSPAWAVGKSAELEYEFGRYADGESVRAADCTEQWNLIRHSGERTAHEYDRQRNDWLHCDLRELSRRIRT
jgi:hypothetical protein